MKSRTTKAAQPSGMTTELYRLRANENLLEFAEMGYALLVSRNRAPGWIHLSKQETSVAGIGRRTCHLLGVPWRMENFFADDHSPLLRHNLCVEAESFSCEEFSNLLDWITAKKCTGAVCGTGFVSSGRHRDILLKRFPNRITLIGTAMWMLTETATAPPKKVRGALMTPCFQDNWRLEQNLGWRPELVEGLDVHIFDDNYQPAESERLTAVARECGWYYHRSGLGEHPDYTSNTKEFSTYNRFIFESYMTLVDDYDFVVKLDTDACILQPDWWHEIAARLTGRTALLGTFDLRPLFEVGYFWHTAWKHGCWYDAPPFPLHLQGGIYALSQNALYRFREMGFVPGPHHDFGEDGYMSYFAQVLGIELLPATTFGSWTNLKRPSLESLTHLKAIHPLMRRDWNDFNRQEL